MATEYPPNEHYEVMTHREDRVSYLQEQIRLQILFNFHRALDLFLIVFKLFFLGLKTSPIEWSLAWLRAYYFLKTLFSLVNSSHLRVGVTWMYRRLARYKVGEPTIPRICI